MKDNLFALILSVPVYVAVHCFNVLIIICIMHMYACIHICACMHSCSQKVSSKQNTLMKWFSKSPKKESPKQEEGKSKDREESPASKKRKVED